MPTPYRKPPHSSPHRVWLLFHPPLKCRSWPCLKNPPRAAAARPRLTRLYTRAIRIFGNAVLPCLVIRNENLESDYGMNQPTAQLLTATGPHSKIVVTHSKQSHVTFSNRNIKPCVAMINNPRAASPLTTESPFSMFDFPGIVR